MSEISAELYRIKLNYALFEMPQEQFRSVFGKTGVSAAKEILQIPAKDLISMIDNPRFGQIWINKTTGRKCIIRRLYDEYVHILMLNNDFEMIADCQHIDTFMSSFQYTKKVSNNMLGVLGELKNTDGK